jgi:cytochrome c oxidase subunit 2
MSDFPLFPAQASTIAWQVDALYLFLVVLTIVFCLLVFGMVTIFAIKYRRRSDDEQPEQNHGNLALELSWTIIPLFIALFVFLVGADVFFRLQRVPPTPWKSTLSANSGCGKFSTNPANARSILCTCPKANPSA